MQQFKRPLSHNGGFLCLARSRERAGGESEYHGPRRRLLHDAEYRV
jgi:hypothetical protein